MNSGDSSVVANKKRMAGNRMYCAVCVLPLIWYHVSDSVAVQVDPFRVRYCPRSPTDEGIYIVKLFAADQARFFWEASWQVTIEATGETFRGRS
jgi:hypothetical protein